MARPYLDGELNNELFYKLKITEVMKAKKMAGAAKKSAKKAVVVSMAALAAQTAIADLKAEFGKDYIPMDGTVINYTWNPFDGMLA